MSADRGDDKKLLPEILPTPRPLAGATPQQRVNERARLLLQRFRGLGATAGAAILSLQCGGYGVVDPLPPPPAQCSTLPDPFAALQPSGTYDRNTSDVAYITLFHENATGFTLGAVRVTEGGTLANVETSASFYLITVALDTMAPPPDAGGRELLIEVDLSCGAAAATLHYRAALPPPTAGLTFTVERL